jgi:hypothetical protein
MPGNFYESVGAETEEAITRLDTGTPHNARIYNYWLGGKDNFSADRAAGDKAIEAFPDVVRSARANRAFLRRAVRYLTGEAGIRQFLDVGTGLPSASNTHEVAQAIAPDTSVVYVDNDPIVLAHARALLTGDNTAYLDADARRPEEILDLAARKLDFGQPVAVMFVAILHMLEDADNPWETVGKVMAAVPGGSYLVLSHPAADIRAGATAAVNARLRESMRDKPTLRDRESISRFFAGLDFVAPGFVRVPEWRPGSPEEAAEPAVLWGGVAHKP